MGMPIKKMTKDTVRSLTSGESIKNRNPNPKAISKRPMVSPIIEFFL